MQTHGGEDAEKAILASERDITISLRVDWNGDGFFSHPLSDLTPYVSNVTLDRALSGSTPEDILLVEGNAAAELEATLSGEYQGMQLPAVFSPYTTVSPLYGKPLAGADIQYDIIVRSPLGEFVYPQFRGFVRTVTPDRGPNDVTLTALDYAEVLRRPVKLPPWAVPQEHINYGELSSVSIYSSWVIDHCLRLCDVSPTPYRPAFWEELPGDPPEWGLDGVMCYITGNAGYLPTVGWLDNLNADTFPNYNQGSFMYAVGAPRHPYAVGLEGLDPIGLAGLGDGISDARRPQSEGYLHYWSLDRDKINTVATHYLGFTLNRQNGPDIDDMDEVPLIEVAIGNHYYLYILLREGQVKTRRRYSPTGRPEDVEDAETEWIDIPEGDNIDIHAAWDNSEETGTRAWIGCRQSRTTVWDEQTNPAVYWPPHEDDDTYQPWEQPLDPETLDDDLYDYDFLKGRVKIGQAVNMSDIFYATRNWYGAPLYLIEQSSIVPAKYPAVLDLGVNRLGYTPYIEARDGWDIICDVAGAEFGSVFFDENGVFRFWNWNTMLDKQRTSVRTFTLDEVEGLNLTSSLDSVRNVITVQAGYKRAVFGNVYKSQDPNEFYTPATSTREWKIWIENILSPLTFRMGRDGPGSSNADEWRWEGVGTTRFHVWDPDAIDHGFVLSFYNEDEDLWEEDSSTKGTGAISIDQYFSGDGFLVVRIENRWTWDIRLATSSWAWIPDSDDDDADWFFRQDGPGERPAYHIGGTYIEDLGTQSVIFRSRDSMLKYGARNLELKGDWYHDTSVAPDESGRVVMLDRIMRRVEEPLPTTDAITVAGDPRLQLGDSITITDPDGFGEDLPMQILGIHREWDIDAGLTDTLTVQMFRPINDRPPSNVDAGPDVFDWPVGQTLTRTGTYDPGDGSNIQTEWEVVDGTSFIGEKVQGDTVNIEVTGEGWWRLRFTVTTEFGSAWDTFDLHTEQSGGGMPVSPGDALWIGPGSGKNHFNVGIGIPDGNEDGYQDGDTIHIDQDEIEDGFVQDPNFILTENGDVQFRIGVNDGRTSQGTNYPRSELRELDLDGDLASWDSGDGLHWMEGRSRITHVAAEKPWVCFFQIHDASSDLMRVQTEVGSDGPSNLHIKCRYDGADGEEKVVLRNSYTLGTWIDWRVEIEDGLLRVWFDDELVLDVDEDLSRDGCYFKTGCYAQSNTETEGGDDSQYFAVELAKRSLRHGHPGWPSVNPPQLDSEPLARFALETSNRPSKKTATPVDGGIRLTAPAKPAPSIPPVRKSASLPDAPSDDRPRA